MIFVPHQTLAQAMIKNIIILFLSILTSLSRVFAYKQKEQAAEYRMQILEARIQAENARKLAEEQYHLAKEQAAISFYKRLF